MSTFLHSSALPPGSPLPKTSRGLSRADERAAKANAEKAAERACYAAVDARDNRHCRVCGRRVTPGAIDGRERAEHHHLTLRSRGGQHEPKNVATLCARCHAEIHVRGLLRLSGDADAKDEQGQFCGISVERYLVDQGRWSAPTWR